MLFVLQIVYSSCLSGGMMPQSSYLRNQWPTSSDYGWYTQGDYGWYTQGDYGWYTQGDDGWYTQGDYGWYTSGDPAWPTPGDYGWPTGRSCMAHYNPVSHNYPARCLASDSSSLMVTWNNSALFRLVHKHVEADQEGPILFPWSRQSRQP